ncbi:MFS transporter [Amaricoccus solimangrovi]|uniref:MFS transporter n=1 Tax=Amaricoccus solimangrovi TaxID=2589815 RepID=UPI0015E3B308|nr:MFS transporter [Amaricoccus solimangrovi]
MLSRTFSALGHRNYRLLWVGTLISNTGDWLDQVALNWLVVSTSGSPFELALVNLCRAVPILAFTLIGGAVADRVERRRMMMVTQSIAMLLAFALAAMVLSGHAPLWAVLVIATGRGIVISFNLPARHSLIAELVPAAVLPNAVALNSLTINVTKIVGPALAGLLIASLGTGICFLVNGLSFLVVIWTLHAMRFEETARRVVSPEPLSRSIAEGLAYTWRDTTMLLLVLVALVPTFFGQPYMTLLAVFAYDVFDIGPEGLGLLSSCAAAGAVGGALLLAAAPRWGASALAMLVFLILFGVFLVGFSLAPALWLALPLLFSVGATHIACSASNNTLLQLRAPDHMRGRILSIMLLNRGLVQLGAATWAGLAGLIGVRQAMAGAGLTMLILGGLILAFSRLGKPGPAEMPEPDGDPAN